MECAFAGQQLVQQATERPDVRAGVDRLTASLLGAHVGRRPHDRPATRIKALNCKLIGNDAMVLQCPCNLSQPKVKDFDGAVTRELYVGWLEIAMNDSFLVRGRQ